MVSYIRDVFLPCYNAKFASPINDSKNNFVEVAKDFDYNKQLVLLAWQRICHHSYIVMEGKSYAIFNQDGTTAWLGARDPVEVYIFLDGTRHVRYKDTWYDLRLIERVKKPSTKLTPEQLSEVRRRAGNKGAANSPWRRHTLQTNFR